MFHDILGWERAAPWLALAFGCGYFIGAIPFGMIMARLFRLGDLRKVGSGNIGATNVLRTGNKAAAALTLLMDMAKGAIPVLIFTGWGPLAAMTAGLGAFLGHLFPVWLLFRGGKGVATFLGVTLALDWPTGLACCLTWLAVAALFRISSLAALVSAALAPVYLWIMGEWGLILLAIVLACLLWIRHAGNIGRLLSGREPRIGG